MKKFKNKYWEHIRTLPNVVGYSNSLQYKISKGKELPIWSIRIYVSKKVPIEQLKSNEIIPAYIEDVPTDVVEIGKVEALSIDKTKRIRPVPLGVSIGHWNITAGSLGHKFYKGKTELYGSNAHVLTDDPTKSKIEEKRICQPGPYHSMDKEANVVGYYVWHKRIKPIGQSECLTSNLLVKFLNYTSRILKRKTRFYVGQIYHVNNIDFGVYSPIEPHEFRVADDSLNPYSNFIGLLFAGSPIVGVICKVKYMIAEGYIPVGNPKEVKVGDKVKGVSFWCNYTTEVIDDSANIVVGYGNIEAYFEDVILVKNTGVIRGGWSGSGFYLIEG